MTTEPDEDDDIINPIDLKQIKAKTDANAYVSLHQFLIDFQWFAHNYEIMYTSEFLSESFLIRKDPPPSVGIVIFIESTFRHLDNDERTKRAKKLLQLVVAEIDSVKTCLGCHINANTKETRSRWFTMVHRLPHLIIWAHKKNARYWPAKVMSVDEQHVKVYFFGSYHKHAIVPVNKCYLYSRNSPTNHSVRSNDTEFESALKVKQLRYFQLIARFLYFYSNAFLISI